MTPPRTLIANLGLLGAGEAISRMLTLVAFTYLARVLGPGAFGKVEFALALLFILSLLIDFGLGALGVSKLARDSERTAVITHQVVTARIWLMFLAVGALVSLSWTLESPSHSRPLLWAFGLSLLPAPLLLHWVFQGRDLMRDVATTQIVRYATFALLVLGLIRSPTDLLLIALAEWLAVVACVSCSLVLFRRRFGGLPPRSLGWPDRALLRESLPIALSQFMWAIKFFAPTVLLGLVARPEVVGHFAAALRIVVALHAFIGVYFYALLPAVARCAGMPPTALRSLIGGALRASAWVLLLGCLVGGIGAPVGIRVLYGPDYSESAVVLQILLWMLGAALWSTHYRCTLIAYNRQGLELVSSTTGAGVSVLLIVLLYPRLGLVGAAWAMLAGEVITLVVSGYCMRQIAIVGVWRHVRRPLAVGVAMTGCVTAMSFAGIWIQLATALAIFSGGLWLLDAGILVGFREGLGARRT